MVALVIKTLKRSYGCATEFAVEILGGKWKTVILALLKEQDLRYGELRAALPALSDKVLTERLRELEALGLVERPSPGTLYRLSPRGRSLAPILQALYQWGTENAAGFGVACGEPLARLRASVPA
jgi:DNA-binding HxlR family transcriptional regulator